MRIEVNEVDFEGGVVFVSSDPEGVPFPDTDRVRGPNEPFQADSHHLLFEVEKGGKLTMASHAPESGELKLECTIEVMSSSLWISGVGGPVYRAKLVGDLAVHLYLDSTDGPAVGAAWLQVVGMDQATVERLVSAPIVRRLRYLFGLPWSHPSTE